VFAKITPGEPMRISVTQLRSARTVFCGADAQDTVSVATAMTASPPSVNSKPARSWIPYAREPRVQVIRRSLEDGLGETLRECGDSRIPSRLLAELSHWAMTGFTVILPQSVHDADDK
jgi:hypothetical protein